MPTVSLPYPDGNLNVKIESDILGEVLSPKEVTLCDDPAALIRESVNNPIGTPQLEELLKENSKVAIVVDDVTRETPAALILPHLLSCIHKKGIKPENVSIAFALGTHRPMTQEEINEKLGPQVAEKYPIVNRWCTDKDSMTYLGESAMGIPIWVHKEIAQADVRIGIGMIVPHLDAGYGGGAKIILPGVCGLETIEAFHARMVQVTENQLGLEDAVLRQDLEEFVQENLPLAFIVNVVLDRKANLFKCLSGDPIKAHRAGIKEAKKVYSVTVSRQYPIVIANAEPHHIDFWQATKALASGEIMTEDQGSLIVTAQCREGMGDHPDLVQHVNWGLNTLLEKFTTGDVEDKVAAPEAVSMCRIGQRLRLALVSPYISHDKAKAMGFTPYDTIEEALAKEMTYHDKPQVGVLTHGGSLVPQVG